MFYDFLTIQSIVMICKSEYIFKVIYDIRKTIADSHKF
jgi:hypothetical protein